MSRSRTLPIFRAVVLTATALWCGGHARFTAFAQTFAEPLGPVVSLRLPELASEIHRQKFRDAATGTIFRRNVLIDASGRPRLVSDEEVRQQVLENARLRRERIGAIQPRFYDAVTRAAVIDPGTPLPTAVVARFDPLAIAPGPSLEEARRWTDDEGDQAARDRAQMIGAIVQPDVAALADLVRSFGASDIRASRLAPVVYARLRPADILSLARETDAVGLVYDSEITMVPELSTSVCSIGADKVQVMVSAGDFEAAVLEYNQPDRDLSCLEVPEVYGDGGLSSHPTGVAAIIASQAAGLLGVAPGVNILGADMGDNAGGTIDDGLEWGIDHGADIYNMSFGTDDSGDTEIEDMVVDWYVRQLRRTVVKSAGNVSNTCTGTNEVTSPGQGFNMITVGNYSDMDTCGGTDVISTDSCFGDPTSPHNDREKPEVAAPGTNITTLQIDFIPNQCLLTQTSGGTSFAAPHVTGAAALLMARDSGLKEWPETMKAVLMASAFNDVDPGSTERQGAGGIDVGKADDIVRNGRYSGRVVTVADFDANALLTVAVMVIDNSVQKLRGVIAWDSYPTDEDIWSPNDLMISDDFDLYLFKSTGELVAQSTSWDNSFELVELSDPPPGIYELKVHLGFGVMALVPEFGEYLGVAWGVVDPCLYSGGDVDNDGVCQQVDNCPMKANGSQTDSDGDGLGNDCDNCPYVPNPGQENDDWDSKGNACDDDDDNDGCKDPVDEHPHSQVEVIGAWFGPLCNPQQGVQYGFEGIDSDGDGILNCAEPDDDGDGIPDVSDACPTVPGTNPGLCRFFQDCPGAVWWDVCQLGGCNEFLIKLVAAINPDPTQEEIFDQFAIVNRNIYLAPPPGKSLSESAHVIGGQATGGMLSAATASAASAASAGETAALLRMEIWTRGDATSAGRFATLVAEYDPSMVVYGALDPGALLLVTPPASSGDALRVEAVWTAGALPGPLAADADRDVIPDPFDNCETAANRDQADADGDAAGDLCDCATADPGAYAVPSEIADLAMAADRTSVSWVSALPQAGPGIVYDLLRGAVGRWPVGSSRSEVCAASGIAATRVDDPAAIPSGGATWYLVRGRNVCGAGPYGFTSSGDPEVSGACDVGLSP